MRKRLLVGIAIIGVTLLAVVGTLVLVRGQPGTTDAAATTVSFAPTGPLDQEGDAVRQALVVAKAEGMTPLESYAATMSYGEWARTTGAELGSVLRPDRPVWVVVFKGTVTPHIGELPWNSYDNFEVILDEETGAYLGSGSRNPGVQSPFPIGR